MTKLTYKQKEAIITRLAKIKKAEGLTNTTINEKCGTSDVAGYFRGATLPTNATCVKIEAYIALTALERSPIRQLVAGGLSAAVQALEVRVTEQGERIAKLEKLLYVKTPEDQTLPWWKQAA